MNTEIAKPSVVNQREAPSIGSISLDFDPMGNRVRQIVEELIEELSQLQGILRQAKMFGEQQGATRFLVRALTSSDIPQRELSTALASVDYSQEARVDLAGRFEPFVLGYYGYNIPRRTPSEDTRRTERELVANLLQKKPKSAAQIIEETYGKGYIMEKLEGTLSSEDQCRLAEMYKASFSAYPFNIKEMIVQMVRQPSYQIYAARSVKDRQLHAVCVTEQVTLNLPNGEKFRMREMGDSAKMPGANGLNAPLKLMLVRDAFRDDIDLVFCETRASLGAVNAVNQSIGMTYAGFLPLHTLIDGPSDIQEKDIDGNKSPFGNMNVWALSREDIAKIGSEVV